MNLNFPKKQEIKLKKSPLDEVICQVKFSPILSIARELPVDFQEAIRGRFPEFDIEQGVMIQLPSVGGGGEKPIVEASPKVYNFWTSDKKSKVALSTDFFAITTNSYTHWSDFVQLLNLVSGVAVDKFHPAYATRVGLRFINKFTRKNTGSNSLQQILDLFRNELTCLIHTDAWERPDEMVSQMVLADNQAKLALRIGLGKEQKEHFMVLDFDYFEEGQLNIQNLAQIVENYHSRIYDAFRWCLKDEGLDKFEPDRGD